VRRAQLHKPPVKFPWRVGFIYSPGDVAPANRNAVSPLRKRPGTRKRADLPRHPDYECKPRVRHGLKSKVVDVEVLQGIDGFVLEAATFDMRTEGHGRRVWRGRSGREQWKWHVMKTCETLLCRKLFSRQGLVECGYRSVMQVEVLLRNESRKGA
jgi:hypothetical protein